MGVCVCVCVCVYGRVVVRDDRMCVCVCVCVCAYSDLKDVLSIQEDLQWVPPTTPTCYAKHHKGRPAGFEFDPGR